MKLFIDSANIEEIRKASELGIISGVTTNPSLIAKEGKDLKETIEKISKLIDGPISAEVQDSDADSMYKEAIELSKIHPNIVIKIPMTLEGIKCTKRLSKEGIATNVTLIFSLSQAIMACEAGATYISPFLGRIDDIGESGQELLKKIMYVINSYNYDTQVIAASIRNLGHIEQASLACSDIATIPYQVLMKMVEHPLTAIGLKTFNDVSKK